MANFYTYLPLLQNIEKGFQKHAKDFGNYNSLGQLVGTNYGIAATTYELWIKRPPTEQDMRSMNKETAIQILKNWYWNVLKGDSITNQSIAEIIVDHGINAGVGRAAKLVQSVLNNKFNYSLSIDGVIGNNTLRALNTVNQELLHKEYKKARENYYATLGGEFYDGWIDRLNQFSFKKKA